MALLRYSLAVGRSPGTERSSRSPKHRAHPCLPRRQQRIDLDRILESDLGGESPCHSHLLDDAEIRSDSPRVCQIPPRSEAAS